MSNEEHHLSHEEKIESEILNNPDILTHLMQNDKIKSLIVTRSESSSFSGPLPPPNVLASYEQILPGAADRVFQLTETQSKARQGLQEKALNAEILHNNEILRQNKNNNFYGFVCALALLGLVFYCVYINNTTVAIALIGVIIGLTALFVGKFGKKNDNKSDNET